MRFFSSFLFLWLVASTVLSYGGGNPTAQWRGPSRDGIYPCTNLLQKWPEQGPERILTLTGSGKGYSQPVVANGIIYITGVKNDSRDVISAYDFSGQLLWDREYGMAWDRSYPETRSTPTIENDRIYLVGGQGMVSCLDARSGEMIWQKDAHKEYRGAIHRWGVSESVLLTEKAVIYTTGGNNTSVVALDKTNGNLLWKTESMEDERAYTSPLLINRGGLDIILAKTSSHLLGIDARNGAVLWTYNMLPLHKGQQGSGAHNNTPLYRDGEIFITNGYDRLAVMLSLADDGRSVSVKWTNDVLDVHHGGVVEVNGHIYGANWQNNTRGKWASIRWDNGATNWETEWHTKGSVIFADGMLYIYEERGGHVALVKPDPQKMDIVGSFRMKEGEGPHWAHPAIYDGLLFIRHGDVVGIYDIRASRN